MIKKTNKVNVDNSEFIMCLLSIVIALVTIIAGILLATIIA